MAINYEKLSKDVTVLLQDLGTAVTITHLEDNSNSKGFVVFSSTTEEDSDASHVSTLSGTERTAFVNSVKKAICIGDTLTADSIVYRINQVTPYKPARTIVGYKLVIDA